MTMGANETDIHIINTSIETAQDLLDGLESHVDKPSYTNFSTSLTIIIVIHIVFIFQWSSKQTRRDVITTYRQVVEQKKFHRAILGILSHPSPDNSWRQPSPQISIQVPLGNNDNDRNYGSTSLRSLSRLPFIQNIQFLVLRVKGIVQSLLLNSPLSSLPLMLYISHIIWSVRPLETIYDYEYDRQYASIDEQAFNTSRVLEADIILQHVFEEESMHRHKQRSQTVESFRYHRVCLALVLTSFLMDIFMTRLGLDYLRKLGSRSRSSLDSLMDRGICTLTPLCTSLLVIYSSFFPHTSISVLPFFNTSRLGMTASTFGFSVSYGFLLYLSRKPYSFLGVFYGFLSGLLWVDGVTSFLGSDYWGGWCTTTLTCIFMLSYKSEYSKLKRSGRASSQVDWLPCVEVNWDSNHESHIIESNEEHID